MKRFSYIVVKNTLANLSRLGVGAVVALALPRVLTRVLPPDRFAAWVLLLQVAAYANFLDFGIQTAVSRFIAQATEQQDFRRRDAYISTAVVLLSVTGLLGFLLVAGVAWCVPHLFRQAPASLLPEFRAGLLVLAALSAVTLPTSAFTGAFMGLHRNEFPALIGSASRLLGAIAIILTVHRSQSLVLMAALVGAFNLAGGLLQFWKLQRELPEMSLSLHAVSREYVRRMLSFCAGLSIMSVAMLLVGGLDLTIVGYFNFSGVAFYSVASSLVLLIGGLAGAAANALVAPMATIHARNEHERLGNAVLKSTRHLIQFMLLVCFPILLFGNRIFTLWLGPLYARNSTPIMDVLVVATVIRLIAAPYTSAVIAAGEQTRAALSPIVEGVVNLIISIIGAAYWGPIGVAWGTLVGAACGVLLHMAYNMVHIADVRVRPLLFLRKTTLEPMLMLFPLIAGFSIAFLHPAVGLALRAALIVAGTGCTLLLFRPEFHALRSIQRGTP